MMMILGYLVVFLTCIAALVELIRMMRSQDSAMLRMQKVMGAAIFLPLMLAVLVFVFVLGPGVSAGQSEADAAQTVRRIQHAEMVFNKAKEAEDKLRGASVVSPSEYITTVWQKRVDKSMPAMRWWLGGATSE